MISRDRKTTDRDGARSTGYRPRTLAVALAVCALIVVGVVWVTPFHTGGDRAENTAVIVVAGTENLPPTITPIGSMTVEMDRVAASEYAAAQPPAAGPGPADTRPPTLRGYARFEPVRLQNRLTAIRLRGSGTGVVAAGFRDGDLITSIGSDPVTDLPPDIDEARLVLMLAPGVSVEVIRYGQPLAWRIGGKAE
jgi:hypothetical protein